MKSGLDFSFVLPMPSQDPTPSEPKSIARRSLLAAGGSAAVLGVAGYMGWRNFQKPSSSAPVTGTPQMLSGNSPSEFSAPIAQEGKFQPYLNSDFSLELTNATSFASPTVCRLVSISPEQRQETFKGTFVAFSLLFEAPANALPEGGICRVKHAELEEMELFVSPVGKAKGKTLLEAVFSSRV